MIDITSHNISGLPFLHWPNDRINNKKSGIFFNMLFKKMFILREREREREREKRRRRERGAEGKRDRRRENPKQAPHCQYKAQCGA